MWSYCVPQTGDEIYMLEIFKNMFVFTLLHNHNLPQCLNLYLAWRTFLLLLNNFKGKKGNCLFGRILFGFALPSGWHLRVLINLRQVCNSMGWWENYSATSRWPPPWAGCKWEPKGGVAKETMRGRFLFLFCTWITAEWQASLFSFHLWQKFCVWFVPSLKIKLREKNITKSCYYYVTLPFPFSVVNFEAIWYRYM